MRPLQNPTEPYDWGRVTAVLDNGDVTVSLGNGTVEDIPCLYGYWPRYEGQTVLIQRVNSVLRFAVGPIGGVGSNILALPELEPLNLPPTATIEWGNGAPSGAGWDESSAVSGLWIRDGGGGERSIYVNMGKAVSPPSSRQRMPIWVTPTWTEAWREGQPDPENDGRPAQSMEFDSMYGHWSGGWGFTDLTDRIGSSVVSSMKLEIKRQNSNHGINDAAVCNLYLASAEEAPRDRPIDITNPWSSASLQRGQRKSFTLNSAWRDALVSGARDTIICHSTGDDFIIYEKTARLYVEFE